MRAIGIILAGGNSSRMRELTNKRATAAMPIASSYRAIDFALSSMSNSNIQKVAVLTQYNSRSLHEHLSAGKWWNFGQKQGGLFVFTPTITMDNGYWYRGTADAIYQNLRFLRRSHEPYVVIASGDGIYKLDFNKVLAWHESKHADITIITKELPEGTDVRRFGTVVADAESAVTSFVEKPEEPVTTNVSTGIYIIRRRLLIDLIEQSVSEDRFDLVNDVIVRNLGRLKLYAYPMQGYWASVTSAEAYYKTNMDFLRPEIRRYFFHEHPDVYSIIGDNPPAKYNPGSNVKNSIIGCGSIVNGTVEDSVIFKNVFIGNGCTIKNSIIMHDVYIGDDTWIENSIVESGDTIRAGSKYIGENNEVQIVIEKSSRYEV